MVYKSGHERPPATYWNVEELISRIAQRPQMYIGILSIRNLFYFLQGHYIYGKCSGFSINIDGYFHTEFLGWVQQWFALNLEKEDSMLSHPWYQLLIEYTDTEEAALQLFFEVSKNFFKEYHAQKRKKIYEMKKVEVDECPNKEKIIAKIQSAPQLYLEEVNLRNLYFFLAGFSSCRDRLHMSDYSDAYYTKHFSRWLNSWMTSYLGETNELEWEPFWYSYVTKYVKSKEKALQLFFKASNEFFTEYHQHEE
ncbi:hypothetical protein I6N95_15365 [Vagococcus sp. BWB3-3]|uniref:Uncharacterized protein n=1 Tax=Vagococcus allomyrinae TaxID=2794353 RepID=A0A940PGE0_9ENTE|nr:hypothetical protein [Vagococcus allomyrinae]MBP1042398.1 hypothetical protein [Vagococcus allomyrinae]